MRSSHHVFVAAWLLAMASCSSERGEAGEVDGGANMGGHGSSCDAIPVDRFKELLVVDESIVGDPRAKNVNDGAWSFRHLIEELTPPGTSASALVLDWLRSWQRSTTMNLFPVAARAQVETAAICPWLKRTAANACDETCGTCKGNTLDLAKAPFRLIGIANRLDLAENEERGTAGETRLVFALTDGAADDPRSRNVLMTVGFEYANPMNETSGLASWAQQWHALGASADDEAMRAGLQALTDRVVTRSASPKGTSALGRVRTNENVFDWTWDLRQFDLGSTGLQLAALPYTPDASLNGTQQLADYVMANRAAVLSDEQNFPAGLAAGAITPASPWVVPGVDEALRKAFALHTCDGCHRTEAAAVDLNFHLSPVESGRAKVSAFLNDAADPTNDELARRTGALRRALCGEGS